MHREGTWPTAPRGDRPTKPPRFLRFHPLEAGSRSSEPADTPARSPARQAPQLSGLRFAAKKVQHGPNHTMCIPRSILLNQGIKGSAY